MLQAYDQLMRAGSMPGQENPLLQRTGYKEGESSAMGHMKGIIQRMREIEGMYADPSIEILPEHHHEYKTLEGDLRQMYSAWEHARGKQVPQKGFQTDIQSGARTRDLTEQLLKGSQGVIPPAPR